MTVQSAIESKLGQALSPEHLLVENESHLHSGPATESHFKITVVTARFSAMKPVRRHQEIYGLLAHELSAGVHALALHAYTPGEWAERSASAPVSPNCRGGSSHPS